VLDAGFWAGITLYPESKTTPARAVDMYELYGRSNIWLNSACDWGRSDPLSVPKTALEMRRRGHSAATIDRLIFQNPARFMGQNPRFQLREGA
jgi:predicted metal-dependent TIM-barrel fold hydrolase